ncbi:hypothetical protein [Priestia megaterium]|uniref:hypothetical protein n=1 Tax=Priestia megaterium TaxID=1404 RepID=UPI0034591304
MNTWSTFGEYGALVIGEDFAPSIDIQDTWLVVEKLKQEGFYSTHTDLSSDTGQEWWSWHFTKGNDSFSA